MASGLALPWAEILRRADKAAPGFRKAFLAAVAKAQNGASVATLRTYLSKQQYDKAAGYLEAAWGDAQTGLETELGKQTLALLGDVGQAAAGTLAAGGSFELLNPAAIAWAKGASSKLVVGITDQQRAAIRAVIGEATAGKYTVDTAATALKQVVGLDTRRAAALGAYRGRLVAAAEQAIAARPGISAPMKAAIRAKVDQRAEKYRLKLLRSRTETIARTETAAAANEGNLQAWRQAEQAGKFPPGLVKRWVTTPDDRRCPYCAAMQGRVASLGTPFDVPVLGSMQRPPAHPNCRCTITLVRPTKGQIKTTPQIEGVQSFKSVGSAGAWTAKGPQIKMAQAALGQVGEPLGYTVKGPYKTKASAQSMISHHKVPAGTTKHELASGQWELHVPISTEASPLPAIPAAAPVEPVGVIAPAPVTVSSGDEVVGQFFVKDNAAAKAATLNDKTGALHVVTPAPFDPILNPKKYQWQVVKVGKPIEIPPVVEPPPPPVVPAASPQAVIVPSPVKPVPPSEPPYVVKGPYKTKESAKSIISHKQAPPGSTVHPVPGGTTWEIHVPVPAGSSWMETASQAHPSKTLGQLEDLLKAQKAKLAAPSPLEAAPVSDKTIADVLFVVQHDSPANLLEWTMSDEAVAALKKIDADLDSGWYSASDSMKAAVKQKLKAVASWETPPIVPGETFGGVPVYPAPGTAPQGLVVQTFETQIGAEGAADVMAKTYQSKSFAVTKLPSGSWQVLDLTPGAEPISPITGLPFSLSQKPIADWTVQELEQWSVAPGVKPSTKSMLQTKLGELAGKIVPDIAQTTPAAPSLTAAATQVAPPLEPQVASYTVKGPYKNKISALSAKSKQKLAGATAHEIPGGTTWELHIPTGSPAAQTATEAAAPAAPIAPFKPPAFQPTKAWVDDLMSRKIANASGSNPGGLFQTASGQKFYVKQYKSAEQTYAEALTNRLYGELGAQVPESYVAQTGSGQTVFVSRWLDGVKGTVGSTALDAKTANQILDHFVADVFVDNWDAVGTGLDNVVRLANGTIARIDQGGSLIFRAQGSLKPTSGLNQIGEWESFLTQNAHYKRVFDTAGLSSADELGARAIAQIDRLESLAKAPGFSWRSHVNDLVADLPAGPTRDKIARQVGDMLESRFRLLLKKRDELKEAARLAAIPPTPAPPVPVAKLLSFDEAVAITRDRPGAGGFVPWDGGDVEDLGVQLRGVKIGNEDWTEIKYKLTADAGKALRVAADAGKGGFTSGDFKVMRQTISGRGTRATVDQRASNDLDHFSGSGRTFSVRRPGLWADFHVSANSSSGPYAINNTVQIFVKGEPTEAQLRSLLAEFGVRSSRAAEQADFAALAENKLARLFQVGAADLTPAEKAKALGRARALGITPADVRVGADEFGRPQAELTDAAVQKLVAKTRTTHFIHALSSGGREAERVVELLAADHHGLVATTRRFTEGIGRTGMSSMTDVHTGGADYVFTRQQSGGLAGRSFSGGQVVVRPSAMARLDWYSYASDTYGAQNAAYSNAVRTRDNIANLGSHGGGQETMFKGRISWNDVAAVYVQDANVRAQTIAKLRARGITSLGGQTLEQFIRVPGVYR